MHPLPTAAEITEAQLSRPIREYGDRDIQHLYEAAICECGMKTKAL